jgi:hypothetical protein
LKAYLWGYLLLLMIFAPVGLGLVIGAWAVPAALAIYYQIPRVCRKMRKAASRG